MSQGVGSSLPEAATLSFHEALQVSTHQYLDQYMHQYSQYTPVHAFIITSLHGIAMPKGLYFTAVVLYFFLLSFFIRHLIFEVNEWISTKLGHKCTYDSYLKNLVPTSLGIYPLRARRQECFLRTDFEL